MKRVVDRHLVLERDDAQHFVAQFWHGCLKPNPVVFLRLRPNRLLDDTNTPFLFQVGPLPEYFGFEILGKLVLGHFSEDNTRIIFS